MKLKNKYEKNTLANKVPVIACLSIVLGLVGCQQEGTAEKAGQKIDRAAENVQQKIEQATEKTAQKIEGAKESLIDKAQSTGEYIDDSVITTKVKTAILNDPILNASRIEVTTVNGVVKLSGTVDSEPAIGRAMEVASNQKNVKSVQTDLLVNATSPGK
jgi:hyperosmotically inducible periplasmic protein